MASRALKIAVAGGTGNVGSTLASKSSDPTTDKAKAAVAKVGAAAKSGGTVTVATTAAAAASSDVVILALPSETKKSVVEELAKGLGNLSGKVVIDATNPWVMSAGRNDTAELGARSLGELWASLLPGAHVFKAFNSIGVAHMADPTFKGQPMDMLYAGPAEGRDIAERVIADVGFKPVLMGPIAASFGLEAIAELWIAGSYVWRTHTPDFGFVIVHK